MKRLPIILSSAAILFSTFLFGSSAKREIKALKSLKFVFSKISFLGLKKNRLNFTVKFKVTSVNKVDLKVVGYYLQILAPNKEVLGLSASNKEITLTEGKTTLTLPFEVDSDMIIKRVSDVFTAKEFEVNIKGEIDYKSQTIGSVITVPVNEKVNLKSVLNINKLI